MKQRILPEQLNELSRDAFEIYQKSFKIELGDLLIIWDFPDELRVFDGKEFVVTGSVSKLVKIGQMIEFLREKAMDDLDLQIWINSVGSSVWTGIGKQETKLGGGEDMELCDALWEAVKETLSNI